MLAIIGGTGLSQIDCFKAIGDELVQTPYAETEVCIHRLRHGTSELVFLPRHGKGHVIPPHRINYRANIWALRHVGVTHIVAVNAVGGIHPELSPGMFAVPDQIIDYTSGRSTTFFEDDLASVQHIDFTKPYDERLRVRLMHACADQHAADGTTVGVLAAGVYGCTDGPRLETAAEIRRLRQDGCDMVGMTGMPEAALARELDLAYASLVLSVNWAAGISAEPITLEKIHAILDAGKHTVQGVLQRLAAGDYA